MTKTKADDWERVWLDKKEERQNKWTSLDENGQTSAPSPTWLEENSETKDEWTNWKTTKTKVFLLCKLVVGRLVGWWWGECFNFLFSLSEIMTAAVLSFTLVMSFSLITAGDHFAFDLTTMTYTTIFTFIHHNLHISQEIHGAFMLLYVWCINLCFSGTNIWSSVQTTFAKCCRTKRPNPAKKDEQINSMKWEGNKSSVDLEQNEWWNWDHSFFSLVYHRNCANIGKGSLGTIEPTLKDQLHTCKTNERKKCMCRMMRFRNNNKHVMRQNPFWHSHSFKSWI